MRQKTLSFCLPVIICIILLSCSKKEGPSDQVEVHHDIIAAHTSAVISCDDPIRVRFVKNMVPAERIDTTIDKPPIKFEPTIKGTAVWSGANMLEFRPANRLPQNMAYTATVLLSELVELVDNVPTAFSFDFKTMEQAFEVTIDGLQPYPKDPSLQTLGGKISTADTADNESVEKILSSFQGEKALSINWVHAPNRKNHAFIISDIQRKDKASEVSIQWDGSAIQVDKKGQRFIDVPAVSTFAILKVRPIQGKTQYVEIQFSDPLDTRQDLNGLIAVTDYNNLKLEIDKNIIRVYSSKNWPDKIAIEIRNGIRNAMGYKLEQPQAFQVFFGEQKPEIRFTGKGVIFPTHTKSTIPVETMNLRAVIVQATRIHEQNIPQFLQVNTMEGWSQLNRVGRVVWEKTVPLDVNESQKNEWVRHGLDISPLINQNPGGIYQITLSFDPRHTMYNCPDLKNNIEMIAEPQPQAEWQEDDEESSFWDYYEADEGYSWTSYYENRMNPCHPAFYRQYYDHNIKVSRNVFVSDIGLIAKAGSNGDLFVAVTDIRTTEPLSGVALEILDFQQEVIARAKTSKDGTVTVPCDRKPFLVIARKADQTGYLKMDDGSSLSTSHFDVAGETISNGVKGFIYGERGVWRPGDDIYLTFILLDTTGRLPENHPVIFQFRNPKGQLIQTIKKTESDNGFYTLTLHTDQDAPTGNWKVSVRVGGATFEKALRVETVMPNRLKINLDFGDATKSLYGKHIAGKLSSTWLHGAIAKNLKANIKLKLTEGKTVFPKYEAYVFDDPSRLYDPEEQDIFEGTLDEHGKVSFIANIQTQNVSPGMLMANFTTRVFEPGGAFSTDIYSAPYHPYDRYIGILTPKGDKTRGMLLTDTPHKVLIAAVDREGKPVPNGNVDVELYKIKWRWWWEKGAESIAEYIGTSSYRPIQKESLKIKDGQAEWTLEVKYPEWGRYLIRAKDAEGKHAAGKIVYIDWPGWAGRSTENNPGGAAVLTFTSDKDRYDVGEQAVVTIPTGKEGRGLVSFETGTKVLKTDWFEATGEEAVQYKFTATADMAPTVYVHVTYLQPHLQTKNDLPIRMYGVIPVNVVNPETRLKPEIVSGEVFKPEDTAVIKIKEASGKPMTYTLAIVDVGLLDLTRFTTPDPWSSFFKREALGIKTWDMFNFVAGAYGGTLENILAIGGDDVALDGKKKKANRFPPMVRFLGPFDLGPGKTATHVIDIPQYIGAVRVMAVAGRKNAFGSAEKTVVVRKPLMLLGTLPRVLGPNEEVELPVSVFALEDHVKDVSVSVKTNDMLSVKGQSTKTLAFNQPGDDIIFFKIKVGDRQGVASVFIKAAAGGESAEQRVDLDIRMPGGPVVDVVQSSLSP
ncbi:MAG: alpha-2-macroglobulin family protein, partial [Thermodesulfobacteriota bacterium]